MYKVLKIKSHLLYENDELPCSMGQETVAHDALLLHLRSIFATCVFWDDRVYSYQKRRGSSSESATSFPGLLKVVASEVHDEERIKVMAVYRDTDLQQYNPSCPASRKGSDNDHKIDIADLLDVFQSLGIVCKLLLSEICTLAKLTLVIPDTNAVTERLPKSLK